MHHRSSPNPKACATCSHDLLRPPRRYLRAAELEMRAAEEPLRSALDVKGLKAQVLGRIEELEAREREREELVAEITAMALEHGFDAGTMKAVMGG